MTLATPKDGLSTANCAQAPENPVGRKAPQILAAARAEFLKHGFAETSMETIARAANVSKATLYAYFPSKEALFSNLIQNVCVSSDLVTTPLSLDDGLPSALKALGEAFVSHFLTPDATAFFQTVSSERQRFPDLCRLYFNNGQRQVVDFVAAFLEEARAKGLIAFDDAHLAANQLLNLVLSDLPIRVALGLDLPDAEEARRVMEAGVALFLRAYGRDP